MKTSTHIDKLLERIALEHLHIQTLETQHRDRLDFHDVAVWSVKAALQAAYEAGVASASKSKSSTTTLKGQP